MPRATDSRLEKVRAGMKLMAERGYPEELTDLFIGVRAVFDNAERLVALFGIVDEASAEEAWALYRQFSAQVEAARPTLH